MSVTSEQAVRAWVNSRQELLGTQQAPGPLAMGAFLRNQASPASGAYAVLAAAPPRSGAQSVVAEDGRISMARIIALVYAGTTEAAELAAVAYANAVRELKGNPVQMGSTGVTCLVTDNLLGPAFQPTGPAGTAEQFCYSVDADFMLYQ